MINKANDASLGKLSILSTLSRGVLSREFFNNEEEKSLLKSCMVRFLVILHIQINKFNYTLLITPKIDHHIDVGKLCPKGKCCSLPWLDYSPKKSHGKQTKSV